METPHLVMREIRDRYRRLQPRGHWFDKDTMHFFRTELPAYGYVGNQGVIWFVTAETGPNGAKRYTIRRMDPDGWIRTEGEFQQYGKPAEARAALREIMAAAASRSLRELFDLEEPTE